MISSPIPPHPPHAPLLFCSCSALYSLTFGRGTCCGGPPQPAAMTTTSYVVAIANCRLPGSVGVDRDFPFPPVRSNSMERQESTPALGSLSTIISLIFLERVYVDFQKPGIVVGIKPKPQFIRFSSSNLWAPSQSPWRPWKTKAQSLLELGA